MSKKGTLTEMLSWRYAHRGLHKKPVVPENSMAAFGRAVLGGFGIELDVHLTQDSRLAVIHDSSLKRTCGVDLVIEDMKLAEAQVYFLEQSQERIPSLEEVLKLVGGRVPLIVELKASKTETGKDTTEELCRETAKALDSYAKEWAENHPLYCVEFKVHRPDMIRGQLAGHLNRDKKTLPWISNVLLKNLWVNLMGKPDFVAYRFADRKAPALKRYQGPLFFWTIKKYEDLKEAESLGAAGIFEGFDPREYEEI